MTSPSLTLLPHEVVAAFVAHTKPPRQDQILALAEKRINKWSIAGSPAAGEWNIAFGRITRQPCSRFEFAQDGEPAMCALALNANDEAIDIVASGRDWIAAWLGCAAVLGEQHVDGPRLDEALTVFPTMMEWLKGDRLGVVLVDRPRAAIQLRDCGPFLATGGIEHAAQLVALLTSPPPLVLVPVDDQERHVA